MAEHEDQKVRNRQFRAAAMLLPLALGMLLVMAVTGESSWQMWLFGGLMVFSAAGMLLGQILQRRRPDTGERG